MKAGLCPKCQSLARKRGSNLKPYDIAVVPEALKRAAV